MKTSHIVSGLALLFSVAICNAADVNEYLGSWVHVKFAKYSMVIEKNGGDGLIIRQTMPNPSNGKQETKNIPATFKDGMITFAGGFGALAIDRSSGHLTSGNAEYKRPADK